MGTSKSYKCVFLDGSSDYQCKIDDAIPDILLLPVEMALNNERDISTSLGSGCSFRLDPVTAALCILILSRSSLALVTVLDSSHAESNVHRSEAHFANSSLAGLGPSMADEVKDEK